MKILLISLGLYVISVCGVYSQWVLKARFGLGNQYPLEHYQKMQTIYENEKTNDFVRIGPSRSLGFSNFGYSSFHFDLEINKDSRYWIGLGANLNSIVGIGSYMEYSGHYTTANDDIFSYTVFKLNYPGNYYSGNHYVSNGSILSNTAFQLNKYKLSGAYYFIHFSHKNKIVSFKNNDPIFSMGVMGGVNYLLSKKSLVNKEFTHFNTIDANLNDGSSLSYENKYNKIRRSNLGFDIGLNLRFRIPTRHEICTFSIWYTSYIWNIFRTDVRLLVNGNEHVYTHNTRGSQLAFKLSFPVFSYNFTKKKFYRD